MDEKEIIQPAIGYYILMEGVEEKNYENSKSILKDLLYAHGTALGVLHSLITSKPGQAGKTDEKIDAILIQIAVFYRGIATCDKVIRNAQYNIAAALIRQEYEIICNINEIKDNLRKPGKAPNAKSGFPEFGRKYKLLSELTHVIENNWDSLYKKQHGLYGNDIMPIVLTPEFDEDMCIELYGMHIYFICNIVLQLADLFTEMYDNNFLAKDVLDKLVLVYKTLLNWDIIKINDNFEK